MTNEERLIDFEKSRNSVMEILAGKVSNIVAIKVVVAMQEATVDAVEVVHGRWIKKQLLGCEPFYLCSVCGKLHDQDYNFCNNCGAKMDGGNEDG